MRPTADFDASAQRDPVRILLLEDDPTYADLLRTYLGRIGWTASQLEWVGTLDAAVARLALGGFDLVIADLGLPDSPGGMATLDALKRATDRVVVVVSGNSEPGVREALVARGAYDFLHKDRVDTRSLERLVRLAAMQAMAFRSLRDSQERLSSMVKLSSDFYWEQDEQFRFTYLSEELAQSGRRTDGALGKTRWELDFAGVSEAQWSAHRADLEAQRPFRGLELMRRDQKGEERWVSIAGEPVFDAGGKFRGYRGVGRDITARKLAEQEVRRSEERFRSLTELSSDWYWEQDAEFRFTYMAGRTDRLGRDLDEHIGRRRWDLPAANLDDAAWGRHRAALERHEPFRDFEIQRHDDSGRSSWASLSGVPIFDADGRFTGYRGIGRDITARKVEDIQLRQFRAAMDTIADMVMLVDVETLRYIDINATASRMLGYTREELLQLEAPGLSGYSREEIKRDYAALIESGETTTVENVQRHRDGRHVPVEILRRAVRLGERWVIVACVRDITERRQNEQALRDSSERFRSLTDLSADMYWEQDAEYRFTVISGRSPGRLKAGRVRMMGKRRWEQSYFNMDAGAWAEHRGMLDERRPFRGLELGRINEAGDEVWVGVSGEPVFGDDGAFRGYRGVGTDITARKRNERLLHLEHTVTRCLADADTVSQALREVTRSICEAESYDSGRYFEIDEAAVVMRLREAWDSGSDAVRRFNEAFRGQELRPGMGVVGEVWASGQPIWVPDIEKDGRFLHSALAIEAGLHGTVVFPISFEGRSLGVFSMSSSRVRRPDERLLQTMRVVGSQVGQYLMRMQAEEDHRRFRLAMEHSADLIVLVDRATMRFVDVNDTVCKLLGYSREELLAMSLEQILPVSRAELEKSYDEFIADPSRVSGMRSYYVCKDGSRLPFESTRRVLRSGERWIIAAISRDIRARIAAEDELRRFRTALDASADMTFLIDVRTSSFVDFNETACRVLGYSRAELAGMKTDQVRIDRSASSLQEDYARFATDDRGWIDQGMYRRKDGSRFPVEIQRRVLETPEGPIVVATVRDLTEQRRAEERQSAHLRYQEKVADFGQAALGMNAAGDLMDNAIQAVLEGLRADAVAYLEPGADGTLVVRSLAGSADAGPHAGVLPGAPADAVLQVLKDGEHRVVDGTQLPFAWARALRSVAVVPVRANEGEVRGALCAFLAPADAFGAEELNFVGAAAGVLSAGLLRSDSEGRLAFLAQFDALTGLPNRALLADRFSQTIVLARRHRTLLGVLFIDLDDFKLVNDTLGHAAGDELLKETARRLQAAVRSGDTVARISGDEFAVVLNELARQEDAGAVAQKIIERLSAPVALRGQEVFVTASIGIAAFPGDGDDAEALLGAADAAMYRAKQSGRNAYQFFTAEINQRTRTRAQLGSDLRRALEREEFALVYQPKIDLRTGLACAGEALLRWKHPERGMVSPAEFIPVLEETGLIVQVGEWVLARACRDVGAWRDAGLATVPIAVNLSARQFRQQDLEQRIRRIVEAAGVPPSAIELEITESQLMQDPDHAIGVMRALDGAGIRIAIDDFGTGYSSLAYLTRFPVSSLKIDRSFVTDLLTDQAHAAIARAIIDMAHTLGFIVVAEGVETEGQAAFLRGLGCEQAQGYLFHRPMPAEAFGALLATGAARSPSEPPSRAAPRAARRRRRPSA